MALGLAQFLSPTLGRLGSPLRIVIRNANNWSVIQIRRPQGARVFMTSRIVDEAPGTAPVSRAEDVTGLELPRCVLRVWSIEIVHWPVANSSQPGTMQVQ